MQRPPDAFGSMPPALPAAQLSLISPPSTPSYESTDLGGISERRGEAVISLLT